MRDARRTGLLALLAVLVVLAGLAVPTAPSSAEPTPAGATPYDATVSSGDCELVGREYVRGKGCARKGCVDGAVPFRKVFAAEACALKGQPKGYGFVATVPVRTCEALHRRWIAELNYCASQPDRSVDVSFDAPQCTGSATVYVTLKELDGYDDECVTLDEAYTLTDLAVASGTSLPDQVALRSSVQCDHRPQHVLTGGVCVDDPSAALSPGGTLMIGDSLTWRGSDELTRIEPGFTIDGEPARPATELAGRLAAYREGHEAPTGLIIELGTVPAPGFGRADLVKAVASVPSSTKVMLVLPHFEVRTDPVVVSPQSGKVGGWMRALARSRKRTCLADWPVYVGRHRGILADGVHTKHGSEGAWARWISQEWKHC